VVHLSVSFCSIEWLSFSAMFYLANHNRFNTKPWGIILLPVQQRYFAQPPVLAFII